MRRKEGKMRKYLRKRREELALSQKDVAKKLGISQNYYCDIENLERQQDMKASILIKLSEILKIPASDMLAEERKIAEE